MPLLKVENLSLTLASSSRSACILDQVSFEVLPGEIVGIVGESGSGKSMTASALLDLLPTPHTLSGKIEFEGKNLLSLTPKEMNQLRGNRISLILQDPDLALNPLIPIGKQLIEGLCYHKKLNWNEAYERGIDWLSRVGIGDPRARMKQYPHEISGGMKQRLLIAMGLICNPSLLIADEPTTALDVTLQAQILDLICELQKEENMSLLLITHDLGVVARICQKMVVMYAGQVIEAGDVKQVFQSPQHPYTQALLQSRQSLMKRSRSSGPLLSLEGSPPQLQKKRVGCPLAPRCPSVMPICLKEMPLETSVNQGTVRCWLKKTFYIQQQNNK